MSQTKMKIACPECERTFTVKSNLNRHLRAVHGKELIRIDVLPKDFDVYKYKCMEGCNISYKYNCDLRNHLRAEHNLEQIELNLEFPNSEEFTKWLHQEEANNFVQYVRLTATKKRGKGVETYYYECNRSGRRISVDDSMRKRKPKKGVTQKLNRGCTSQIIVTKSYNETFLVTYYKTHYGHETGLQHVKLSKRERGAIASKLLLGIPVSNVLSSVQNTDGNLKRINLLRRKDVSNIRKSFNIALKDSNADTIDLNLFISECAQQDFNPVLYYNLLEYTGSDDICLIVMSKYQSEVLLECTNNNILLLTSTSLNNCDFELFTLFVVYESGDSFPGACMFSNKKSPHVFELFFKKIEEKVGQLTPAVLMTNIDDIHYKAWTDVMEAKPRHLYNPLQIELDWKLNLNQICGSSVCVTRVKRNKIYDNLQYMRKLNEEPKFLDRFKDFVKALNNDADFKDFAQYFLEKYNELQKWVDCYRQHCKITAEQVALITNTLKDYLKTETETRFDKNVHSLIRYVRDETVNCMINTKAVPMLFVSDNDARHHVATTKVYKEAIVSDHVWSVKDESATYVIQEHFHLKCCHLTCSTCCICIHCFSCTCVDFFISNAICVHIHHICMKYFQSLISLNQEQDEEDDEIKEETSAKDVIVEHDVNNEEDVIESLKRQIEDQASVLCETTKRVKTDKTLRLILDGVNDLCELSEQNTDSSNSVLESEPSDKSCDYSLFDHCYI